MQSNNQYTKSYYTIGEVADMLDVDQHVVRFWSEKFKNYVKPLIKAGKRRNYSPQDIETLTYIKNMLYVRGLSIKGALLILQEGEQNNTNNSLPNANNSSVKLNEISQKLQQISNKIKELL